MIVTLCAEMDVDVKGGGSTTFRRADLDRGLEPDECYYIDNERLIRGLTRIDLCDTIRRPISRSKSTSTSSSLDRMSIYAALGVPGVVAA